jgi:MOSC domain-containing protein YiiM
MKLVSVNVGQIREVHWNGHTLKSAILKEPVTGPVAVRGVNLEGDTQQNRKVHGGPYKAVYGYASEYYEYWKRELPQVSFPWGAFGENLTTEGLTDETLNIGDHLRIGSVVLQVVQPRMPCSKLQFRFQREDIIGRFIEGRRHGFYFSIVEEGSLKVGDPIEFVHRDPHRVSIADITAAFYRFNEEPELLERIGKVEALAPGMKSQLVRRAHA